MAPERAFVTHEYLANQLREERRDTDKKFDKLQETIIKSSDKQTKAFTDSTEALQKLIVTIQEANAKQDKEIASMKSDLDSKKMSSGKLWGFLGTVLVALIGLIATIVTVAGDVFSGIYVP